MNQPTQSLKGILSTRRVPTILAAAAIAGAVTTAASAASLSGSLNTAPTAPVNLTTEGTLDWAIWNYTTNPINGTKTAAPSNRKASVTPVIGSVTTLVGNARGTTSSTPTLNYTYTDGTAFSTLSPSPQSVVFDASLNNADAGFTFTITGGPAGVAEVAKLYLSGFAATPQLTVSLPGATDYTDQSVVYITGTRPVSLYTINFTPEHTGDLLTVTYKTSTGSATNGNVDLQAVAVSPAPLPEPTTACVLALAATGLLTRRRR